MVTRRAKRGQPGERARMALEFIRQRYEQQVQDLDTAADLAEEIAEREGQLGPVAARLQESGMSISEVATCIGAHPNRLRRLIDRHHNATEG